MTRRTRKQLIYGAFYLSVFLGIISLFYFRIKPSPSCFDGIQNQGEEGVDCGGPCVNVCIPGNIKPVSVVGQPLVFRPDRSHITLLVEVGNPNQNYASKNFSYIFSLYDDKGALVQSFPGSSYIYGGEVKYIIFPNAPAPQNDWSYARFAVKNTGWVPSAEFPGPPRLDLIGAKTAVSGNNLIVNGQAVNNDTITLSKIKIIAVLKGKLGQVAGASQTEIDTLIPNESRPFVILHPFIPNIDFAGTKVAAYAER